MKNARPHTRTHTSQEAVTFKDQPPAKTPPHPSRQQENTHPLRTCQEDVDPLPDAEGQCHHAVGAGLAVQAADEVREVIQHLATGGGAACMEPGVGRPFEGG